jgi:very-short-patch-repair endonuclease
LQKEFDLEWESTVDHRFHGRGCPYLLNLKLLCGFNDLQTRNPSLAAEWHPTKNGSLMPSNVLYKSKQKVWWYLPYDDPSTGKHFDFEWEATVFTRSNGHGCIYLCGAAVWPGFNDLQTLFPSIAKEWHPYKNHGITPAMVTAYTDKKVWWITEHNGQVYEWYMAINARTKQNQGCPILRSSKLEKVVAEILKENNIQFTSCQIFNDFKTKRGKRYRFDLYLKDQNVLIECDGNQHFEIVNHFGGKEEWEERVYGDNQKNQYAENRQMSLLRIPYIYHSLKDRDRIANIIMNFLQDKIIPQEIIEFYERFHFLTYSQYALRHNTK